jgi:hypothetical protein
MPERMVCVVLLVSGLNAAVVALRQFRRRHRRPWTPPGDASSAATALRMALSQPTTTASHPMPGVIGGGCQTGERVEVEVPYWTYYGEVVERGIAGTGAMTR